MHLLGKSEVRGSVASIVLKTLTVIVGLSLISLGVVLTLASGLGVDSFTVFYSGISKTFHISIGTALQICMAALLLVIAAIDRHKLGFGTVLHAILIGTFTDLLLRWHVIPAISSLPIAMLANIAGLVLFGFGSAVYIKGGMGAGAIDAAMLILNERTGRGLKLVRIGINLAFAAAGFALGGDLGAGTAISVIATGPIIEFSLRRLDELFPGNEEGNDDRR